MKYLLLLVQLVYIWKHENRLGRNAQVVQKLTPKLKRSRIFASGTKGGGSGMNKEMPVP
jgi:hypothetical protein